MPGRPWPLRPSRTRFVTSPRIGYASRPNGQLTAEVSHLLDLQPCWLLLGLAPTGKRRLRTAHTHNGRRAVRPALTPLRELSLCSLCGPPYERASADNEYGQGKPSKHTDGDGPRTERHHGHDHRE